MVELNTGRPPPADHKERLARAQAILERFGDRGRAADCAAYMWSVRGMDIVERERRILARWPGLSVSDQMSATRMYHSIVDAEQRAPHG